MNRPLSDKEHQELRKLYDSLARKVTAGTWQNETYNQGLWDMMKAASTICEQAALSREAAPTDDEPQYRCEANPTAPSSIRRKACWLIERGQAEKQEPTLWWVQCEFVSGEVYNGQWTEDANKAKPFETKELALWAASHCGWLWNGSYRATEHVFLGSEAAPSAIESPITRDEMYALCLAIEKLPASEQQTQVSVWASGLLGKLKGSS